MKTIIPYLYLLFLLMLGAACSDDDLDSRSIFDTSSPERTPFDNWLISNYTNPYNIDFIYRLEDIETDMKYRLVPADLDKSVQLAKLVKHLWLEAYDEAAGIEFTRTYVPRTIQLVGSAAYENNGTMVLGTAEGGLKVTLYLVNSLQLNIDFLNYYYFKTMHHEFGHILHQTRSYQTEFQLVSEADYVGGDWYQEQEYHQKGFVSQYAMNGADDDFVENIAVYVTNTEEEWQEILTIAGDSGREILLKKFEMVKEYMQNTWNIDLTQLRDIVLRRAKDIEKLNLDEL